MKDDLINCGERKIQKLDRISIGDICDRYGLNPGDAVEVYIKISKRCGAV